MAGLVHDGSFGFAGDGGRGGEPRTQAVADMEAKGVQKDDIPAWLRRDNQEVPAFLRKQAD